MYQTIITSGPTEIISSGSVMSYQGNPIEITVKLEQDFDLNLEIRFIDDEGSSTANIMPSVSQQVIDDKKLQLTLHNFVNPLGSGVRRPAHIGHSMGRKVYISYRVYHLEDDAEKLFIYTLYRNKEVE